MSKKTIALIILVIVVVAGSSALILSNRLKQSSSPKTTEEQFGSEEEELFVDESGFSFKHPKSITVADETPDDDIHYTLLLLTSSRERGDKIEIEIKDTEYEDLDEWLEEDEEAPKDVSLMGAVSLAGISAKQYTNGQRIWTLAVEDGILYSIEVLKDGDYWENAQDLLVSTFDLVDPEAAQEAPSTGGSSGGTVIYEEEVIVE